MTILTDQQGLELAQRLVSGEPFLHRRLVSTDLGEWAIAKLTQVEPGDQFTSTITFTTVGNCKCGSVVKHYYQFCPNCGAKLDWSGK